MTIQKVMQLVMAGLGQGHFESYQPWSLVTRRVSSPGAYTGHSHNPTTSRHHQCISEARRQAFRCLRYCGAVDIRETFPIWSFLHRHPAIGLPGCDDYPDPPTLAEVADMLKIHLEAYPYTTLPRIQTIDAMGTWRCGSGYRLIAFDLSLKSNNPDPLLPRNRHRRLVRRYCAEAHIQFVHWPVSEVPEALALNLAAIDPPLNLRERSRVAASVPYRELVALINTAGCCYPMNELVRAVGARHHLGSQDMRTVFNLVLWNQATDHDLSAPLSPNAPLVPGGRELRASLRESIFGSLAP